MTTIPQLQNHLIRELMHIIRLNGDGDGMVLLALSGKETFPVFKYVVENHVPAIADRCNIFMQGRADVIRFHTDAAERLVIRFVRELRACDTPSKPLPFENLDVLKLNFYSGALDRFINEVNGGNILLTNLRRVEIRLTFDDFLKIMSTTSSFPLPEEVTFKLDFDVVPDLGPLQTFPNINIGLNITMASAVLQQFSTIINCFTGLETARLELYYHHSADENQFAEVVEFHEWLGSDNFSFPVEVIVQETCLVPDISKSICIDDIDIAVYELLCNVNFSSPANDNFQKLALFQYREKPKPIHEQLKSIGYEEDDEPTYFVLKKEFGNVKLNHRIKLSDKYEYRHLKTVESAHSSEDEDSLNSSSD